MGWPLTWGIEAKVPGGSWLLVAARQYDANCESGEGQEVPLVDFGSPVRIPLGGTGRGGRREEGGEEMIREIREIPQIRSKVQSG